ncbi:MAG TPA: ABC transporter ATP-binding protein [Hyphomicrobiales bacterium]|nr:ABC transporter ATP-binding protein [Hyphomicrobiales bacterium]
MSAPFLEVNGVSKAFGHFTAVKDVSLTLPEGQLAALIGPNGAGTTTFYNMVSGRLKPTSGEVRFRGKPISGRPPHEISRLGISRSFQITNIFNALSVLENVEVALVAHHGKGLRLWRPVAGDEAMAAEGIEILERLGLAEEAHERAGTLSYGDKRLLELAIVLATEPTLVLLDEPTAGLTPEETRAVMELIRKLAETGPYTFFITEHDMEVVFGLAERILVLHRGELLADGTPEEIRNNAEVRTAYLGEEPV